MAEKKVLAWRKYPEPEGTTYDQEALENPLMLAELFDYCQILEATIFEPGWQWLMHTYTLRQLFEINRKSGWFSAEHLDEFERELNDYWSELGFTIR